MIGTVADGGGMNTSKRISMNTSSECTEYSGGESRTEAQDEWRRDDAPGGKVRAPFSVGEVWDAARCVSATHAHCSKTIARDATGEVSKSMRNALVAASEAKDRQHEHEHATTGVQGTHPPACQDMPCKDEVQTRHGHGGGRREVDVVDDNRRWKEQQ